MELVLLVLLILGALLLYFALSLTGFLLKLLIWVMVGALAGFLAGRIMKKNNRSFFMNWLLGVVGALVGGWLLGSLGFTPGSGWISFLIEGVVGSVTILFLYGILVRKQ